MVGVQQADMPDVSRVLACGLATIASITKVLNDASDTCPRP